MSDDARSTLVIVIGAVLVRLAITGVFARYVRTNMRPWLLLAGAALIALGVLRWVVARSTHRVVSAHDRGIHPELGDHDAKHHHHDHATDDHDHGDHGNERVGWLLLAPIGCLLLIAPPSLGSYALGHTGRVSIQRQSHATFQPLHPSGTPTTMTLLEFDERALMDGVHSFSTARVVLTGFVARTGPTEVRIARYQIACCAADAVAAIADLDGAAASTLARDQWVTVTGTFNGVTGGTPRLRIDSIRAVPAPADPYE